MFVPLFLQDAAKLAQLQPVKPTDRDVNDVVVLGPSFCQPIYPATWRS